MSADTAGIHQVSRPERTRWTAARAALRSDAVPAQSLRFGLHFVEMAIAMEIGMMPLGSILAAVGQSDLSARSPEAYSLVMNLSMAIPMAIWMLIRRHGIRLTAEMAAAMIVPGAIVAAGSLAGLLPHAAAVSAIGALMWIGMLAAMAVRWPAYARHHH
jgi:flagellar biosynthetic protein FliP